MQSNQFIYDGTFEGFLSAVFYAYEHKIVPERIEPERYFQEGLFMKVHHIVTTTDRTQRVWKGIRRKTSGRICSEIHRVFLSELKGVEMLLFSYIKLIIDSPRRIDDDYSNDQVLKIKDIHKKVVKEAHRILMFVRFQKTADDVYFAPFEPLYNVLPLTINHFKDRFSDQMWIIYDVKRDYGFYYDLKEVTPMQLEKLKTSSKGKIHEEILSEEELLYQDLWRKYYHSVNIKERKNIKVHKQFLPQRFWKYLPEKDLLL